MAIPGNCRGREHIYRRWVHIALIRALLEEGNIRDGGFNPKRWPHKGVVVEPRVLRRERELRHFPSGCHGR
jgi:hypothetical protein